MHDPVNHPAHYTQGGVECIDAIEAALGKDQFIGFLRGQVLKYSWRCGLKGDAREDAAKALWYNVRLREALTPAEDPAGKEVLVRMPNGQYTTEQERAGHADGEEVVHSADLRRSSHVA